MTNKNLIRFHDTLSTEITLGKDFLYKNSINEGGDIAKETATKLISDLSRIQPGHTHKNKDSSSVSLIILAGGDVGFLLNTLESIAFHRTSSCVDVIVVPFYGEISDAERLKTISWLRVISEAENLIDILRACSYKSETAIFVTQYERLGLGFIDELVGALETQDNIGCAGAKIIGSDGLILEAGGVCYSDAGYVSLGKGEDSNLPEYCYSRKVNAFSGSFAISFETLFSVEFEPNALRCEDLDFFRLFHDLQCSGKNHWVVPLATTIGFGSKFKITEKNWLRKSQLLLEQEKLKLRYQNIYKSTIASGNFLGSESLGEILYFDFMVPDMEADAGSVTCANILRALRHQGWGVTFVPTILRDLNERTARAMSRLGVKVLYRYHLGPSVESLVSLCPSGFDIVVGVRVVVMAPLLSFIKEKLPHCPFVFFDSDLHYLREKREAEILGNHRLLFNAYATKREELKCFAEADCNIVHTDVEQRIVEAELSINNVVALPYSVDICRSDVELGERNNVMFLGGYEHMPNTDAVKYFVADIWPILRTQLPVGTRLILVGSKPECGVAHLACEDIVVTGQVPDLNKYFDSARVFIAPLRYGAGLKGKVLTAMANGVPSVLTPVASEGLPIEHGVHYLGADGAQRFAEEVVRLFNDDDLWNKIQNAGYKLVDRIAGRTVFDEAIYRAFSVARKNWIDKISLKAQLQGEDKPFKDGRSSFSENGKYQLLKHKK